MKGVCMLLTALLIVIAVAIGIWALVTISLASGAALVMTLDLIILGFAAYGFYKFIQQYRTKK